MSEYITDLQSLVSQGRTFATIMGDPPWDFDNKVTRTAAQDDYATMSMDALKAMPVAQLAAKDAHLHLWATISFHKQALDLMEAWGFQSKSECIWIKPRKDRQALRFGSGNYYRLCHEILLLGVKGEKLKHLRGKSFPSVLECPRGQRSRKPDEARAMVEQVSYGPYLELFARESAEGWTSYGNENLTMIPVSTTQPRCGMCGEPFPAKRRSGKYCGGLCRQHAHRQKLA